MGDIPNDLCFEIPPPTTAFAPSVSPTTTPTSTHLHQPSGDSNGPSVPQMPRRLSTKGQRVVITKSGRRKVSSNVSTVPLDGVSFHS